MPRVSQEQARLNRRRVVAVAAELFRERGLHGVGVADIMASAGLTHGGFYGQFASKDALAVEAFDCALAQHHRGDLETLVSAYLADAHVAAPGKGCPIAALVNDVSREAPDSPVRERLTQGVRRFADLIGSLLPKASAERRRRRALASLSTMVGALVLARAVNDAALRAALLEAARSALAPPR
ncbi:TetR/AcrR family transcriptional regulator [Methylobacterium planeticum]|uniref:Helix-turn-helix transcriptional regulator n=1 Tax=Methylobacterium planeticum TaxID=2615211 RepID=A0A6N6MPQ0_9HYPH|nr:helix-turn-helix domain-containing protein [Methylobacterium planeticum]KAB1072279.1 helix-turn-helix transcriptional regulator [Methylobacterium planeticum]